MTQRAEILDVDLAAYSNGSRATKAAIVDGVIRSLATGFVYTSHSIPEQLLDDTYGHLAEFFALDTNRSFWGPNGSGDTQTRADLTSWLGSSTATWKIALGHHPYKSNGPHGNAGNYDCRDVPGLGCVAAPLFTDGRHVKSFMDAVVCGRADVYLSGHDHSLQWLTPTCNGTQLIVSGNGASATTVDAKNPNYFQTTELGFIYIELNGRTFTGTFFGQTGNVLFTRSFTK